MVQIAAALCLTDGCHVLRVGIKWMLSNKIKRSKASFDDKAAEFVISQHFGFFFFIWRPNKVNLVGAKVNFHFCVHTLEMTPIWCVNIKIKECFLRDKFVGFYFLLLFILLLSYRFFLNFLFDSRVCTIPTTRPSSRLLRSWMDSIWSWTID